MDALLIHEVLTDDEMTSMLGIARKELRAVCAKLKEDHLITDHVQKEDSSGGVYDKGNGGSTYEKGSGFGSGGGMYDKGSGAGGGGRQISKTYYYIHYTEAVDAIKWKMHQILHKLKQQLGADTRTQGYICDTCGAHYSAIDAVALFSPDQGGFICEVCQSILRESDVTSEPQVDQQKVGRLMQQTQQIVDTLKQLDEQTIPENTFQSSLAHAIPAPTGGAASIQSLSALVGAHGEATSKIRFAGESSKANGHGVPAQSVEVQITSEKENAELERKRREENARLAEQNALPSWHVESTVGKSLNDSSDIIASGIPTMASAASKEEKKPVVANTVLSNEDKANEEALAAYYAQRARREEAEDEDEEEGEEDEEEEEEEEDDFEDVV